MSRGWRGPFGVTLRRTLGALTLPAAMLAAAAWAGHRWSHTAAAAITPDPAGAAAPWLVVPVATIATACALVAAGMWPQFARDRAGHEALARLSRGPWRGRGAAIAAAIVAQLVLSVPLLLALPVAFGAPPTAHVERSADAVGDTLLTERGEAIEFLVDPPLLARTLWLRPLTGLPESGWQPAELGLRADGELLTTTPVAIADLHDRARVDFPPRRIHRLRIERTGGHVPLWFPPGAVVLVGEGVIDTWQNGLTVALLTLVPSFVTLAVAAALGLLAGWSTLATVLVVGQFLLWFGQVEGVSGAIADLMRGKAIPLGEVLRTGAGAATLGFAALSVTALCCRTEGLHRRSL